MRWLAGAFMSWIPGWDSIEGAKAWSNSFFWASIGSLILLGITEVISHRYGIRGDNLAAAKEERIRQQHDWYVARIQYDTAQANERAAQANERAAQLEKEATEARAKNLAFEAALSPRWLEQDLSAKALNKYAGTRYSVISPDDFEPKRTANQIKFMLKRAGWIRETEPLPEVHVFQDGITVQLNQFSGPYGRLDEGTFEAAKLWWNKYMPAA
jgi:hypothetical protein